MADVRNLVIIICISWFFLFANLGDSLLWQDEAETAIIAKNIITIGGPKAFNGVNLVWQIQQSFDDSYTWKFHPWLQFYATAASFLFFGYNTFAARFPHALIALFSIIYFYYFCRKRMLWGVQGAFFATILLILSVPFLLYARQCRYYSLTTLFVLIFVDNYISQVEHMKFGKRLPWPQIVAFSLSGIFLFYSNFPTFIASYASLAFHFFISTRNIKKILYFFALSTPMLFVNIVGAIYFKIWEHHSTFFLKKFLGGLFYYLFFIKEFYFPLLFALCLFALIIKAHLWRVIKLISLHDLCLRISNVLPFFWLFSLFLAVNIAFFSLQTPKYVRYIIHLIPFVVLVVVGCLFWIKIEFGKYTFYAFCILYCLLININVPYTNIIWHLASRSESVLHVLPSHSAASFFSRITTDKPKFMLYEYIYELTHHYVAYQEPVLQYLKNNAQPNDTVLIGYEDLPIIFYSGLRVRGGPMNVGMRADLGEEEIAIENITCPNFVIWRGFDERTTDIVKRKMSCGKYEDSLLDGYDIPWENRPDPWYHKFRSPNEGEKVIISSRIKSALDLVK